MAFEDISDEAIGFSRGGAISDGDQLHVVLLDEFKQDMFGVLEIFARRCGVDCFAGEELSGAVDDGQFAAGAVAGIDTDGDLLSCGCGHEQVAEIFCEDLNSFSICFFALCLQYGGFCGGAEQSLEAVDDGVLQFGVKFEARIFEESVCELSECLFGIEFELQFEDAF